MSPRQYLRGDEFARQVTKLEPPWRGLWIDRYLEIFDESGVLRPIFRVIVPERFAHYRAQRHGLPPLVQLHDAEVEEFERVDWFLAAGAEEPGDPERPGRLDSPPAELAPCVRRVVPGESVDWAHWKVTVGVDERDRPYTRPSAFSFYASWQRLRCWALLERHTYRALLDPRRIMPVNVFEAEWKNDLTGQVLTWTVGHPRPFAIVERLEGNRWLETLYLARDVISWGRFRAYSPELARWEGGKALSPEARADGETQRVRSRCSALAESSGGKDTFWENIRQLLRLWDYSTEHAAREFADVVEDDIEATVRWAAFAFGVEIDDVDAVVGAVDGQRDLRVARVLRPAWYEARQTTELHLPDFVPVFNETFTNVKLDEGALGEFLAFLDANELGSWYLEFAAWVHELQQPTDVASARRFLHLRSLALLHEQILVALADRHGNRQDRLRMKAGKVLEPLKAFLADRRDWRALVWQRVDENYRVADSRDQSLSKCLEAIAALSLTQDIAGSVRTILRWAALRNFGSHRFTRDSGSIAEHRTQLIRAAVLTPLFYWRVATTLS